MFSIIHLHRWFQQSSKCPLCRYDICNSSTSLTHVTNNEDFNTDAERMILQLLAEISDDTDDYSLVDASNNEILSESDRNHLLNLFQNNYM